MSKYPCLPYLALLVNMVVIGPADFAEPQGHNC